MQDKQSEGEKPKIGFKESLRDGLMVLIESRML